MVCRSLRFYHPFQCVTLAFDLSGDSVVIDMVESQSKPGSIITAATVEVSMFGICQVTVICSNMLWKVCIWAATHVL